MTFPIYPTDQFHYHLSRGDVEFGINDLNNPDCMAVLTSSDARLRLNVDFDAIYRNLFYSDKKADDITSEIMPRLFDEDGNYRTWKVSGFPTYFVSSEKRYCHIVVKYDTALDSVNPADHNIEEKAMIVFSRFRLDFYGRPISDDATTFLQPSSNPFDPNGMEPVKEIQKDYIERDLYPADESHFFIYLGRISSSQYEDDGTTYTSSRTWEDGPYLGLVGTPEYLDRLREQQEDQVSLQLEVDPEMVQFSWMGTEYSDKSIRVKARIIDPSLSESGSEGGTSGGGGGSQQRGLSNVVLEHSFVVREPNLMVSPAQPGVDTQSVFVDDNGCVLRDTEITFGIRQYVVSQLVTEFGSINITTELPSGTSIQEINPTAGQIRINLTAGAYIGTGFSFDAEVEGATNIVHLHVSGINSSQLHASSLRAYRLQYDTVPCFIRKTEGGLITPAQVKYIFIQEPITGSSEVIHSGCRLWYRRDDETTWTKADDIDIASEEGDGRYLASVPTEGTTHKLHVRWTVNDDPADIVERYILGDAPDPEPSEPEDPEEEEPAEPIVVGDYFIVGSYKRMPADGEPTVFSQLAAPPADEGSDGDADADEPSAQALDDMEFPDAPSSGDLNDNPASPSEPGERPADKDDDLTPDEEPDFIIADEFELTPDHQKLYVALFDAKTKKVIDSRIVPVIKDGKSAGNVRPNLLINSCFLGYSLNHYTTEGGQGYFLRQQQFGSYPVFCMPVERLDSEEGSLLRFSLSQSADEPLDGAEWTPLTKYYLSVWAKGKGKFVMSATGALFGKEVSETFELTERFTRYSITFTTAADLGALESSQITIAQYPAPAEEEEEAPAPDPVPALMSVEPDEEETPADDDEEETPAEGEDTEAGDDAPADDEEPADDPAIEGDYLQLACPKLESGESLTDWCLSETDKRGLQGESALSVQLSKVLISVGKSSSVWAEEGEDQDESLAAVQTEVITAKVAVGHTDYDIIKSVSMSAVTGIANFKAELTADKKTAVITFDIMDDFDVSATTDAALTFVTRYSDADGIAATITFVPTSDGVDGRPGDDAYPLLARYAAEVKTPFNLADWHIIFQPGDVWMIQSVDNGVTWSEPMRIVGEQGVQGEKGDGADWIDYAFAISADETTESASVEPSTYDGWHDEPQRVNTDYPFLWMRTTKKIFDAEVRGSYRDGEVRYVRVNGADGADGIDGADGTQIDHTTTEYAISKDGVNHPEDGWQEERPEPIQGWYIWTRLTTYYKDDTEPLVEYYIEYIPNDSEAQSNLVFDLDNEMETVVCDADGNLANDFSVTVPCHLYYGSQEIDTIRYTIAVSRLTMGDFSVSVNQRDKTITVSAEEGARLDADTSGVTVTASFEGEERSSVFTLAAVRNGIKGEHAVVARLLTSISQIPFQRDAEGNLTPDSISVDAYVQIAVGAVSRLYQLGNLPSGYVIRYSYASTPESVDGGTAMTEAVSVTNDKNCLYLALFKDGVLVDRESVPVVRDGSKGESGINLHLVTSPASIIKHEDGTLSADSVICTLVKSMPDGSVISVPSFPDGYSIRAGIDAAGDSFSSLPVVIDNITSAATQVVFELYSAEVLVSTVLVGIIAEGGQGESGISVHSMQTRYCVTAVNEAPSCADLDEWESGTWTSRESAIADWDDANRYMWQATKVEYWRDADFVRNEFIVSPAGVYGQSGRNRISFDLDNEFDAIQYDADGSKISGSIRTVGTVYDGGVQVPNSADLTYSIIAYSGMLESDLSLSKNVYGQAELSVSALTAASGYVVIRASYNGNSYDARFTCLKLVGQDKYELICTPNSIAYNITTHIASSNTVNVKVFRTDSSGVRSQLTSIEQGCLLVIDGTAAQGYAADGFSFPVNTAADHHVVSFVRGTLQDNQVLDTETIPISKTENGTNGISYELVASPSSIIKHDDGSMSQTEVTCNLVRKNADGTADVLESFPASYAAKAGVDAANVDKTTLPITITGITSEATQVVFELYCGSNLIQSLYVPVIAEGGEGQEGVGIVSELSRFKVTNTDVAPSCSSESDFDTWSSITEAMAAWNEENRYMWRATRTVYNRSLPDLYTVSPAGVFGQSGADGVRLDLDNEFDAIQYTADGEKVGSSVTSTATLYVGVSPQLSDVTFSKGTCSGIDADDVSVTTVDGRAVVTVSGVTSASGYVMVNAVYNGNTYYAKFSVQKLVGADKYELVCTPSSIAYNTTTGSSSSGYITVNIYKTSMSGVRTLVSTLPTGYLLIVNGSAATYLSGQGTILVNYDLDDYDISVVKGTVSSHLVLDHETVPINRSADGEQGEPGPPGAAGQDSISFALVTEPDSLTFGRGSNNAPTPDSAKVKLYVVQSVGTRVSRLAPNQTGLTLRYRLDSQPQTVEEGEPWPVDGLTVASATLESAGTRAISIAAFYETDGEDGNPIYVLVAAKDVPVTFSGKNGKTVKPTITDGTLHWAVQDDIDDADVPADTQLVPNMYKDGLGVIHVQVGDQDEVIDPSDYNLLPDTATGDMMWEAVPRRETGISVETGEDSLEVVFSKTQALIQMFPCRILPDSFVHSLDSSYKYYLNFKIRANLASVAIKYVTVVLASRMPDGSWNANDADYKLITTKSTYSQAWDGSGWADVSIEFRVVEDILTLQSQYGFGLFVYLSGTGGDVIYNSTGEITIRELCITRGVARSGWSPSKIDGINYIAYNGKEMSEMREDIRRVADSASGAQADATQAKTDAAQAKKDASTAQAAASGAQTTASAAQTTAAAAQAAAQQAQASLETTAFRTLLENATGIKFKGDGIMQINKTGSTNSGMFITPEGIEIVQASSGTPGTSSDTKMVSLNATGMCGASIKQDCDGNNPFDDDSTESGGSGESGPSMPIVSDVRLKDIQQSIELSLDDIAAAPIFDFNYKGNNEQHSGTSAQYWQTILPNVVHQDCNGYLSLQYAQAAMVAVVSLARRVKELEQEIIRLKKH